jgi:hypothetical protein
MPYQPYDTGWIKSIYSMLCLTWYLVSSKPLVHITSTTCYNNLHVPFIELFNKSCELIGSIIVCFGNGIIQCESLVFQRFNYINPIYNGLKLIELALSNIDINTGNLSYCSTPSNSSKNKASAGKHLSSYFARKRRRCRRRIISISGSIKSNNDGNYKRQYKQLPITNTTTGSHNIESNTISFHPMDDPSCQDITWYDAIFLYWTGGMVWNSVYVLNHQVVSVTTDPIFVSDLIPALELSATIQTPEARSEDKNVGRRTTIALDSGSSIHIFKDSFLLTDVHSDDKRSIGVRTTDSTFRVNSIGRLCDDLNTLPLPYEGYYYYPKGVANILSLAMIAETKRVVMDSAIDNAIYVFNEDGSYYIRFAKTPNGMYCIGITTNDNDHVVMAHQTVKGESSHFSAIDCRRAAKVRDLQEALACPSDFDLANTI